MDPLTQSHFGVNRGRRKSLGSLNEKSNKRSFSEGAKRQNRKRDVSRESSTGSSVMSLDVRCACQYFQCDSLLPDRVSLVGTRPVSRISNSTRYVLKIATIYKLKHCT